MIAKNKGFTLIELLAVIIILSLLALIVGTSVTNLLKGSKDDLYEDQILLIKEAAQNWGASNIYYLPEAGECKYITLKSLKEAGLIDNDVIDPRTEQKISDDLKIKITGSLSEYNSLIMNYEVDPSDIDGCVNIYVYKDSVLNGSNPELYDNLTPVTYDGTNWVVADPSEKWYDYSKQEWANTVILKSGVTKNPGDKVTVDGTNPEALAMFVWIPRYEYMISGQYGKNGASESSPGEIEVNFISKGTTSPTSGYKIHPAFTFGNTQLSGIWVGKFETSHTTLSSSTSYNKLECIDDNCGSADNIRILPNVQSIKYNNVSNFFYAGLSMTRSGNSFGLDRATTDSHMMKNSEWGAVAYLSQSKYGKYGNEAFDSTQKEVYINNSSNFYTGRSGGNVGGKVATIKDTFAGQSSTARYNTYGYYTYDGYKLNYNGTKTSTQEILKGTGASTTGNIYGVYDMSGGSYEYVMSYLTTAYTTTPESALPWGSTSTKNDAGFKSEPDKKYYDAYTTTSSTTACEDGICYGHALSETSRWYGDLSNFVYSSTPWLSRGGFYDLSSTGLFSINIDYGSSDPYRSFRIVLSSATGA